MGAWSRRRIVVLSCAGLLLIWAIAAAWTLFGARRSLAAGAADLRTVRRGASVATLVEPSSRRHLDQAQGHFDDASNRLDSPLLWPLRVLPVAGRHLRAADKVAATASSGTEAASGALRDLVALTERPRGSGPERIRTLRDLGAVAGRTTRALEALDPGSADALVGPLADAVTELGSQRDDAVQASARLQATSLGLAQVLDGPRPYLLLGANNAEMRNGSGMFLSAAELGLSHGKLQLGEVRPTADLVVPAGSVPVTGDLARNWPWLDPGRDLRNLGLTADFPQSARLAVANWAQVPGTHPVAGAIVIDVDGIRSLLRVVGSVEVDGVRYTADTVRGELLRQQYRRYAGDRGARRDRLGAVASAIFERLEAGRWKLEDLGTELADAVAGRHVLIWSTDPKLAQTWRDVGADGHLGERSLSAGLLSRSATKLDSWLDTAADLRSEPAGGGRRRITLTYRITSSTPADGPAYLVGPNVAGLAAGDHRGLVVVNLPAGATSVRMAGATPFLTGGDGPTVVVGGEVVVRRGATVTVTVTALLPAGVDTVTLEPSARIGRTRWTIDGATIGRDRRQTVPLR